MFLLRLWHTCLPKDVSPTPWVFYISGIVGLLDKSKVEDAREANLGSIGVFSAGQRSERPGVSATGVEILRLYFCITFWILKAWDTVFCYWTMLWAQEATSLGRVGFSARSLQPVACSRRVAGSFPRCFLEELDAGRLISSHIKYHNPFTYQCFSRIRIGSWKKKTYKT